MARSSGPRGLRRAGARSSSLLTRKTITDNFSGLPGSYSPSQKCVHHVCVCVGGGFVGSRLAEAVVEAPLAVGLLVATTSDEC